ncbi:ubiquitin-2 like Rad60 SUMO-like-domain-containing protein [Aspergillus crustosus]
MPSYFNKPSWASGGDQNEDAEFYCRAGQTFQDIVAANARERRANISQSRPHKRRRVSEPPEDQGISGSGDEQETAANSNIRLGSTPLRSKATQHDTKCVHLPRPRRASSSNDTTTTAINNHMPPAIKDPLANTQPDMQSNPASSLSIALNGKVDAKATQKTMSSTQTGASRTDQNTNYNNIVLQILITSPLANTKPLMVHRKMSQSLKGVRLAWCIRQNIPKDLHSTIFLTWKGRRLFDVTTCRSLNIDPRSDYTRQPSPFDEYFSNTNDYRICMEAVTEKIVAAGSRSPPNLLGSEPTAPATTESRDAEQHARNEIILKCPGFDDFRIRAPLTTRVSQIIETFREARGISPGLIVNLAFDGDRLDLKSCLADYEITDGDMVDALVKR